MEWAKFVFPMRDPGEVLRQSDGTVFARTAQQSVLGARPATALSPVALWSGTCSQIDSPDDPAMLFESSPHNWGTRGWASLDESVQRWVDAGLGASLLVRTHASHVVSDAPSATRFATRWADSGVRLVYDPVSMVTPGMAGSTGLADLYTRLIDSLENPNLRRAVACVLVCNLRVEGSRVLACAMEDGLLDPALVQSVIGRCADLGVPVAMLTGDRPPYTPPR